MPTACFKVIWKIWSSEFRFHHYSPQEPPAEHPAPSMSQSEHQDLQKLLQLKRYETPGEHFVEDFIQDFHHRQRTEMLNHSARSLLWERVSVAWHSLMFPSWAPLAATACVAALASFTAYRSMNPAASPAQLVVAEKVPVPVAAQLVSLAEPTGRYATQRPAIQIDSALMQEIASEREDREQRAQLLSRHFENSTNLTAEPPQPLILPTSLQLQPVSLEYRP
jgi:hypothetical protein